MHIQLWSAPGADPGFLKRGLAPRNWFKPSSKIVLLTVLMRCFFCGSFMLFLSCVCYAFGHLLSWLSFVMSNCEVVTFPLVSMVSCGA